jgi:uncharacterized spore protein YtfJ
MKENYEELISEVADFLKNEIKAETVIGQQFQLGGFTCVPVIRVGVGLGAGGGEAETTKAKHAGGSGGGAGMGIDPLGFLVTKDDQISFVSTKSSKGLSAAFEKVPDLLMKYFESKKKKESEAN